MMVDGIMLYYMTLTRLPYSLSSTGGQSPGVCYTIGLDPAAVHILGEYSRRAEPRGNQADHHEGERRVEQCQAAGAATAAASSGGGGDGAGGLGRGLAALTAAVAAAAMAAAVCYISRYWSVREIKVAAGFNQKWYATTKYRYPRPLSPRPQKSYTDFRRRPRRAAAPVPCAHVPVAACHVQPGLSSGSAGLHLHYRLASF